ncbi:hypothetical protein ACFVHS_47025 [Streptomyces sp. NPDC057746]|uniref:hypothetical protein n=1 Tax=unclassified Streptomyces TaxID=2593676 RepID=UPI00339DD451
MNHRKPSPRRRSRSAVGLGLGVAASATLSLVAATGTAAAGPVAGRSSGGAAIAVDLAQSRADRTRVNQFDESFRIHEYGPSVAVTAYNRAVAQSVGCSVHAPCRSIALSFQIVTTAGSNARLINATNLSQAVNEHCSGCQTFSAAYQFVVATPRAFTLGSAARRELAAIEDQVEALKASRVPVGEVTRQADALARRVKAVLDGEMARAPRATGADPLADFAPHVTMHRHVR